MINNKYYKVLEAVTPRKRKVCSYPSRALISSIKTTLILTLLIVSNGFCDDLLEEIYSAFDAFNKNGIIGIEYSRAKPESAEEAEIRIERQKDEDEDVAKNKAEIRDGIYYVNAQWVSKDTPEKPTSKEYLKDSDNDGYDDYTEYRNGTNHKDSCSIPAIRNGNNKKIFK